LGGYAASGQEEQLATSSRFYMIVAMPPADLVGDFADTVDACIERKLAT
jgi:hypothetical protein